MKRKKWIAILTVILVLGGVALVAAKSRDKGDPKAENSPFRLGKVQAEDLQVSVREVGVVDPVTKVDVKSAVSGRVLSPAGARGRGRQGRRRAGRDRARRQPGAVALRRPGERDARPSSSSQDAERELATQKALFDAGPDRPRDAAATAETERDLAADDLRARADALPDRRGPRHPDLRQRLVAERARHRADGGRRHQARASSSARP